KRGKKFVQREGLFFGPTGSELLAFKHAGETVVPAEPYDFDAAQTSKPFAVVADFGALTIEQFVNLLQISLRVGLHLLARKWRPSFGLACGVADHGSEIANQ